MAKTVTSTFTVAPGSTLRLQELLAELGYLPLSFTPAAPLTSPTQEGNDQLGTFSWRWSTLPSNLTSLWVQGQPNVITTGAVMNFENQSGLKTDGLAGPQVWTDLLADVQSGHGDANPYNYVLVNKALPETASVYSNGAVVYSTKANTGVAGAPTVDGTFPVYARYTVTTMSGHQPRRLPLRRPGHPVGELLQRRRRPARLRAGLLRLPPERRLRGDAAGQRGRRLPAHSARDPGHGRGLTLPVRDPS